MQPALPLRIRIDDLPALEQLSDEEVARLFGAGFQRRAHLGLETLEQREVMAASITANLLSTNVLKIEGTANADKIYVMQSDGSSQNVSVGSTPGGSQYGTFSGTGSRRVERIEISGLGGDDTISLQGTGFAHRVKVDTTIDGGDGKDILLGGDGRDTIYGGAKDDFIDGGMNADKLFGESGKDTIFGSSGSDSLDGGSGNDYLSGGNQNDNLNGGTGDDQLFGNGGTDILDGGSGSNSLDWLEAGDAAEKAAHGWNAHSPVVGGMKFSDIKQTGIGACAFLSSLAAAVKTGGIRESFVSYEGNYTYRVKFFDASHNATYQNINFNGSIISGTDASGNSVRLDPAVANFEFWTIVYQRAYFKKFHRIDYAVNPQQGVNFGGEHTDAAMTRLMPFSYAQFAKGSPEFTIAKMQSILRDGWGMTASLEAWSRNPTSGRWEAGYHAYVVTRVYQVFGLVGGTETYVEMYNPWASDQLHGSLKNGTNPTIVNDNGNVSGLFSISWSAFSSMAQYYAW